jgi:hypothetical protein
MFASFELLILLLLSGRSTDLVSFLEPKSALEALGEATDEASLRRLIEGRPDAAKAEEEGLDEKAVKTAVENLASSNESVRARAREDLASLGESARARLEDLVKSDPRRADQAKVVLAGLDTAAKAAVSRSAVSRLLAVRLAGDRKLAALSEPVRALAGSPDPFLRQAAAETLARIDGKDPPPPPERPWAKSLASLEALPEGTNYLIDFPMDTALPALAGTPAPRIDRALGAIAAMMGPGSDGILGQATRGILDFVVKCGNVRADRVTVANVGVMSRKAGLAIIVCGEYEPRLFEKGMHSFGSWDVKETAGKKVLVSGALRIVLLDDHHVVLLPSRASDNFPLEEYISAHSAATKPLRKQARWARFLGTLGSSARALILMQASLIPPEGYADLERELGPDLVTAFKGWKEIEAEAKAADSKKIGVRMEGEFEEAKHAADLSALVKGKVGELLAESERMVAQMAGTPAERMMKDALDVLKSIQVSAEGTKGILRGEIDPSALFPAILTTTTEVESPTAEEDP